MKNPPLTFLRFSIGGLSSSGSDASTGKDVIEIISSVIRIVKIRTVQYLPDALNFLIMLFHHLLIIIFCLLFLLSGLLESLVSFLNFLLFLLDPFRLPTGQYNTQYSN